MHDMYEFTIRGYEVRHTNVRLTGNGAHALIPKAWAGKKITVVLTEALE